LNIVIFSPDERSYLELKNVVKEISNRNIPYFYLYTQNNIVQNPIFGLNNFFVDTNQQFDKKNWNSNTLNCTLPFKPDILIISREAWEPEKTIIQEFKQNNCQVFDVENSTWLYSHIKTRLEILSRMRYPTNIIDVFFEHSKWSLNSKLMSGWYGYKSEIVGIPKYDSIEKIMNIPNEEIYEKYNIDKNKKTVILYGSMETNIRYELLKKYKEYFYREQKNINFFYRPHPSELVNYKNDFNNGMFSEGMRVIEKESDLPLIVKVSDENQTILCSVEYYPLIMHKSVQTLDNIDYGANKEYDIEYFKGHEYDFWSKILEVSSWEEFVEKIDLEQIKKCKKRYDNMKQITLQCEDPLELFTDYKDFNASKRIVDFLEENFK